MERFPLSNKPKLLIKESLVNKIDFLHSKVGAFEWSGELITREEGTINDLDKWTIIAEDMFLADIGTAGFTGYEVGKGGFKSSDIIELYDKFPDILEGKQKLHHIHTHHKMTTFFSGTDWENLEDRALVSNYFLMLIVNFDGNWCAKVAFKGKKEADKGTSLHFVNNADGFEPLTLSGEKDNEVLVVMDCTIEVERNISVDKDFEDRYNTVKAAIEAEAKAKQEEYKKKYAYPYYQGGYNGGYQKKLMQGSMFPDFSDQEDKEYNLVQEYEKDGSKKKQKKVMEMTDAEWWEQEQAAKDVFEKDQKKNKKKKPTFEIRHAKALLNSILESTYLGDDYRDCIDKIVEQDKGLLTRDALDAYILDFQALLSEHFDVIHLYKNVDDYVELLEITKDYLYPYSFRSRLVSEMIATISEEINLVNKII